MRNSAYLNYVALCLRIGLAFVFSYAAYSEYISPEAYIHYVPTFVTAIIAGGLFLHLFGIFEIILACWLLSGMWLTPAAFIATVTIFGLTVFNLDSFNILFRNVAIFFDSIALLLLSIQPADKITLPKGFKR